MEKQKLLFIRDFLFKYFVVSLIFAIIFFILTKTFWDFGSSLVYSTFHVSKEEFGKMTVCWFLQLRFFIIFILLVPALTLHWTVKNMK